MDNPPLDGERIEFPELNELPIPVRGTWEALAAELPIPPDTQFSGSSSVRLYELSPAQWEKHISRDPVLAGKVLAVANSAAFGQTRQVSSLARAALLLGYNMLETILIAYHMEGVIGRWPKYPREHFEFVRRWCASSSVCGFHLARAARVEDPELLGTASLLARLGALVLGLSWPAPGPEYTRQLHEPARLQYELGRWHAAACHLSAMVAQQWGLPDELQYLLARHSRPLVVGLPVNSLERDLVVVCCATVLGAAEASGKQFVEHMALPAYAQLLVNAGACGLRDSLQDTMRSEQLLRELQALASQS